MLLDHPTPTAAAPALRHAAPARHRHVVLDLGEREGWPAWLIRVVLDCVQRDLARGRESTLVILRGGNQPPHEVCAVPTQFLPLSQGSAPELPAPVLEDVVTGCVDRTLVILHGGPAPALSHLAVALHRCGVPYIVATHGLYASLLCRKDGPPAPRYALRAADRLKLGAARRVHVASARERDLVLRIAPRSRPWLAGG